jgi:hypothetical protein
MGFSDHHDEGYQEEYPDGKDMHDATVERDMQPSLDEQMSSTEFRLAAIEAWIHNWAPRIQKMERNSKPYI